MKVLSTTLIGALASAIILGVGAAVIVIVADTTDTLGLRSRDFWWLAFIPGGLLGVGGGGVEGLIVSYFQIGVLWTILFGLAIGLIYFLFLLTFGISELGDENYQAFVTLFIMWQVIYPTIISLISASPRT